MLSLSTMSMNIFLFFLTISALTSANQIHNSTTKLPKKSISLVKQHKAEFGRVIIKGNSTVVSENGTFALGFFSRNNGLTWYLGIWYASIATPTYVWVANREKPIKNLSLATLELTDSGKLVIFEAQRTVLWQTESTEKATEVKLLESGNLVTLSQEGKITWQGFDFPTDTYLAGMNITRGKLITSWKSPLDPSQGFYALRLSPSNYGELELVYNDSEVYWTTGRWTDGTFTGVPQMTVVYIYRFHFDGVFTPDAKFRYTMKPLDPDQKPLLSQFVLHSSGELQQFTWSPQSQSWQKFWWEPENRCGAYGACGSFGVCNGNEYKTCECVLGFSPVNEPEWNAEGFSGGCRRKGGDSCDKSDQFEKLGVVDFDVAEMVSFSASRRECERGCLRNCSCIGLYHNEKSNVCKNLYGDLLNLRNLSSDSTIRDALYVRVPRGAGKNKWNTAILIASIAGVVLILGLTAAVLFIWHKRRVKRKGLEDDGCFPVLNLRAFSYKELQAATRGFSEKLGHGGFGTVFQGELSDSTLVAVKRLEKPGGGEKEFRAEVCTIGNIQHVNLVRLRGFCSENSHRLLVYDYMPNGPLSVYLRREGPNLSWDVRFRVAVGTAKALAYLHEECRDCIIHCDIKPENILLDSDFTAKVSDFGLAKLIGRDFSRVLATMRGTWGYVAPEWISGVAITTKADVYSYGMTLLELIGGRRNVEATSSATAANGCREGKNGEKWFFPPWAAQQIIEENVAAVMDQRLGNEYNMEEVKRVALVAVWCIQDDEAMRPTMSMVVKMLEGMVEIGVPPPPKLLQALVSGESFHGIKADSENELSAGASFSGDRLRASGADSLSSPSNITSPVNEKLMFDKLA